MFARTTTITVPTDNVDRGIDLCRDEVLPMLRQIDGFVGLSMLCDRSSGQCIITAAWRDEDALRSSAQRVTGIREDVTTRLVGNIDDVQEWEIAVMHRDHHADAGSCVRATWLRGDPQDLEAAVSTFKMALLPRIEDMDGFCSASLIVDRNTGMAVSSVTFDSRESMLASRDAGNEIRATGAAETRSEVLDVKEYELALAHLDVPEMV